MSRSEKIQTQLYAGMVEVTYQDIFGGNFMKCPELKKIQTQLYRGMAEVTYQNILVEKVMFANPMGEGSICKDNLLGIL